MVSTNQKLITAFEVSGSVLAFFYALLIATNAGNGILGFTSLQLSAGLLAAWAVIDKRWAFSMLQFSSRPLL